MRLHGAVWAALGLFVILYTLFIESKINEELVFFRWAAVALFVWGAWRLTSQYWIEPKKEKKVGPPKKQRPHQAHHSNPHQTHGHVRSQHQTHAHVKPHKHQSHPHQSHTQHVKRCAHCHNVIAHTQYCPRCHARQY